MLGKLIDIIDQLDAMDDSDRFNPMVLYAEGGPDAAPSARAAVCPSDDEEHPGVCPLDPSLSYLLEVKPARAAIKVWSAWRGGRTPSPSDKFEAVMYCARNDAFLPLEDGPAT